jgi:DNA-binding transcriptional ArsR family regulator
LIETLAALAEPTRLRIVEVLGESPRSVGAICDTLSLGQPQVSKHLRVLRDKGVVEVEAKAQLRIYSLRPGPLRELNDWLERYRALWDERMVRLDEVIRGIKAKERGRRKKVNR